MHRVFLICKYIKYSSLESDVIFYASVIHIYLFLYTVICKYKNRVIINSDAW